MVGIIIVSHGDFGKAMYESSTLIMGEQERVETFGLHLGVDVEAFKRDIEDAVKRMVAQGEVLVLTDIVSGTPFNVVCALMEHYSFHHIAGINMPIFLEMLGTREDSPVEELCGMAMQEGRGTMVYVNPLLEEEGQ